MLTAKKPTYQKKSAISQDGTTIGFRQFGQSRMRFLRERSLNTNWCLPQTGRKGVVGVPVGAKDNDAPG